MTPVHEELLREFQNFSVTAPTATSLMERISQRLHQQMTRYNWVGFTPNARIPLNTGLCGAAASSGQTIVVHDVSKDSRYLAGSPLVKSEVVAPILVKHKLAGQLDIESYFTNTFTKPEQDFVEACATVVRAYLGKR